MSPGEPSLGLSRPSGPEGRIVDSGHAEIANEPSTAPTIRALQLPLFDHPKPAALSMSAKMVTKLNGDANYYKRVDHTFALGYKITHVIHIYI
jgi:hypothetical protein